MSRNAHVLLALVLSLVPDAAQADTCKERLSRALGSFGRTASKNIRHAFPRQDIEFVESDLSDFVRIASRAVHYALAPLTPDRFKSKQSIFQKLQKLGVPWGVRIFRNQGVSSADYDQGLANLAAALENADRIALAGELHSIAVANKGENLFIWENTFTHNINANIPFDAPRETLAQRLSAKLLEFTLEKRFHRKGFLFNKKNGLSHAAYADALERLHLALKNKPMPEEFRNLSRVTVTDGGGIRMNHGEWRGEGRGDGSLGPGHLMVPAGLMGKPDRIATAVLEAQIGEMLGEAGHTSMARRGRLDPDIPGPVANGGVDGADYQDALRRFVEDLRPQVPVWGHSPEPGANVFGRFIENLRRGSRPGPPARIVVTRAGGKALLQPMKGLPDLVELHVPIDRLSREAMLEAGPLVPATPGP